MTSPAFGRLPNYSLRGRIAETLREAILSGSVQEGQRLIERKLATELGASLTAVREALIELEMEGFITKRRNAATYVTKLSAADVRKIYDVRRILEGFAFEQAALAATPEQIAKLEQLYEEMLEAARANDRRRFVRVDYSWHEAAWQITANDYLQTALKRVVFPLFAFTGIRIVAQNTLDLIKDADVHLPILEALKARNPEGARRASMFALDRWYSMTQAHVFGKPLDATGLELDAVAAQNASSPRDLP